MAKNAEATLLLKIKEQGREALTKTTEALDEIKGKAALVSAAVTGFIGATIMAWKGDQAAINELNAAIRSQGLEVDGLSDRYQNLAMALQRKTIVDDSDILMGIARAQQMTGELELTDDLIKATVDFAQAKKIDLASAFDLVGKSIGTSRNMLMRHGIALDENASASDKMEAITKQLTATYNGFAEAQADGLGVLNQVRLEFGDLLGTIGRQFEPTIVKAGTALKDFLVYLQNDSFGKFIAVAAAITAGIAGLVTALGTIVATAPLVIGGITALGTALGLLLTPIGAIVIAAAALATAWQTDFLNVQEIAFGVVNALSKLFKTFTSTAGDMFSGFGKVLKSALSLDMEGIKSGFAQIAKAGEDSAKDVVDAYKKGYDDRHAALKKTVSDDVKTEDKASKDIQAQQKRLKDEVKKYKDEIAAKALAGKDAEKAGIEELKEAKKQQLEEEKRLKDQNEEHARILAQAEKQRVQDYMDHASTFLSGGFQGLASSMISSFADKFLPGLGGPIGQLFNILSQDSEKFLDTITQLFSVDFIENVMKNIPILFQYLVENLPEIAKALIQSIISNAPQIVIALVKAVSDPKFAAALIEAIWIGFRDGIKAAVNSVWDYVKDLFKIEIPGLTGKDGKGGVVGAVSGAAKSVGKFLGFNKGGLVPMQKFAAGGTVDTVPAMLTPGEFVVNADATKANFKELMAMNSGGGGGQTVINLTINGGFLGDDNSARQLARAIDEQLLKLRRNNESVAFDRGVI